VVNWISNNQPESLKHQLLLIYLKRDLFSIKEFDSKLAELISIEKENTALNSVIMVFKNLVISDRVYNIYEFPKIISACLKKMPNGIMEEKNS